MWQTTCRLAVDGDHFAARRIPGYRAIRYTGGGVERAARPAVSLLGDVGTPRWCSNHKGAAEARR